MSLVDEPCPGPQPNPTNWDKVRQKRRELDNHQCQTCFATEDLDCHHRTYKNYGKEKLVDVITLCQFCHMAITNGVRLTRGIKYGKEYGFKEYESEVDGHRSAHFAQRSDDRPTKRVCKRSKSGRKEKSKDRSRPFKDGKTRIPRFPVYK